MGIRYFKINSTKTGFCEAIFSFQKSWLYGRETTHYYTLSLTTVIYNIFRDRELAMAKQKATQAYIAEFKNAREEWKVRERQRMEEENIKIRDFARLQQLRESERMENKKAKEESMARVQQAVSF